MMKRFSKRILPFFIVFFLSVSSVSSVYADAGQLVIGGGSIPTGGLSGLDQLAFTVPIFGALLSAFGIGINISEESQQAGMTKTEYIADQILRWKGNKTNAVNNAITEFLGGAQIDINGVIYLTDYALDLFTQFGNWVLSNNGQNFVNTTISSNTEMAVNGNIVAVKLSAGDVVSGTRQVGQEINHTVTVITSGECYAMQFHDTGQNKYHLYLVSDIQNSQLSVQTIVQSFSNPISYDYTLSTVHGNYYISTMNFAVSINEWVGIPSLGDFSGTGDFFRYLNNLGMWTSTGATDVPYDDYFEGNPSEWIDNLPSLDIPQGYTGAIDPGILADLEAGIAEGRDCVISIRDYIEALGEAVNEGVNDVSIPVTDTGTGEIVDIPAVDFPVDYPTYEPVEDTDLPQEEEISPVSDPLAPAEPEDIIAGNTIDLKDFFPFCIPFDFYHLLQKFDAPAQAPSFRIQYEIPIVEVDFDYTIDFAPWNGLMEILRPIELVCAVALLAVATRKFIKW